MRTVELQDELATLLEQTQQPLGKATREAVVLELYRRGIISSGKAGELLGMPRFDFVRYADRLGIAFFRMSKEEWEAEKADDDEVDGFVGFIKDAPEGEPIAREHDKHLYK
jgi:predicted HTH domain antitoxin